MRGLTAVQYSRKIRMTMFNGCYHLQMPTSNTVMIKA